MATKSEIDKRKKELCSYKFRGFSLERIAKILAGKYSVAETTVKQDWYNRGDWLEDVFDIDLEDKDLILLDILAEQKEIKRECWKLNHNTKNESVQLGALKQLREINKDLINILQSVGVLNEEPAIFGVNIIDDIK